MNTSLLETWAPNLLVEICIEVLGMLIHEILSLFINIVGYLDHMHGPSYQMKWWWVALICTMTASISLIMSGVATWDRNIGHEFGSSFSSPTNLESFSHISCFWILFHDTTLFPPYIDYHLMEGVTLGQFYLQLMKGNVLGKKLNLFLGFLFYVFNFCRISR